MKQRKILDEKELKLLPISFQFFVDRFDEIKTSENKIKFLSIEEYKTEFYIPNRFYKPISQLFSK